MTKRHEWRFTDNLWAQFDEATGEVWVQQGQDGTPVRLELHEYLRLGLAVNAVINRGRDRVVRMLAQAGVEAVRPKGRPLRRKLQFWRSN